ncbi:hypothetical protein [Phytomonospora endophytica]|uniref:Uncharacterized protein n=1 Tax=Phytomonospora endophytica TaxID=714109 RepID=A0A841G1J0_9ACTN|nr:hypothetical protein [Phytomonospora endophytica]MBB6038030.1 hypothetical protein [Phytomonospora endophytica]
MDEPARAEVARTPWPSLYDYAMANRCPDCEAEPGIRCTVERAPQLADAAWSTVTHPARQDAGSRHHLRDVAAAPAEEDRVPGRRYDSLPRVTSPSGGSTGAGGAGVVRTGQDIFSPEMAAVAVAGITATGAIVTALVAKKGAENAARIQADATVQAAEVSAQGAIGAAQVQAAQDTAPGRASPAADAPDSDGG